MQTIYEKKQPNEEERWKFADNAVHDVKFRANSKMQNEYKEKRPR